MASKLPIVQYWHSIDAPDQVIESTDSFVRLNPERQHLLYDAGTAADFIAEHLTERESEAFRACGPPAMQADYLRYCAIWHFGGIWADAGFVCVRSLDTLVENSPGGELFPWLLPVSNHLLMNGLFAFSVPQHPFLRLAIDISTELIERRWHGKVTEVTGPLVLTAIYGLYRAGSINALLDDTRSDIQDASLAHYQRYANMLGEMIGDHDRLVEACQGIHVHDRGSHAKWVCSPHGDPPHRDAKSHWSHAGPDIYVT
jgi:mannosyltransferase OCH1-like enzyme